MVPAGSRRNFAGFMKKIEFSRVKIIYSTIAAVIFVVLLVLFFPGDREYQRIPYDVVFLGDSVYGLCRDETSIAAKLQEKTGRLVAIKVVTDENDLMIINKSGIVIRLSVKECRVMGRATQGVRLINLTKKNDVIASVCKVMSSELEAVVEDESRKQMVATNERINQDSTSAPATQFEDGDHIEESDSVADNNDVNNE